MPFADVARATIGGFEPGPARMICIVSLAIAGEPAHLRRLVRRLRERMPGLPVAIGLWRADDLGTDSASQAAVGADAHMGSLREALDLAFKAARDVPEPAAGAHAAPVGPVALPAGA